MIEIEDIGGYATIQGCARIGFLKFGIPKGGFMDISSAKQANDLVGNDACQPLIELFGGHLTFRCHSDAMLSFAGASANISIGNRILRSPAVFSAAKGQKVVVGAFDRGNILYIGVGNGFDVTKSFESASTYVPAKLGPNNGRNLIRGDRVKVLPGKENRDIKSQELKGSRITKNLSVDIFKGPEFNLLTSEGQNALLNQSFQLTHQNRMGYRLSGPQISVKTTEKISSRYVCRGTVQLPPNGDPIVLMSDAQTTGGYPRIAQVAKRDIDAFAQLTNQSRVRFRIKEFAY